MAFMNEVAKIRDKALPYLGERVVDVGAADCKVVPHAIAVDGRRMEGVDICTDDPYHLSEILPIGTFDSCFSSHCLEHLLYDTEALMDWSKLLKSGGHLILYLPQADAYDSYENKEHMRNYNHDDFLFFFKRCFCGEGQDFRGNNFRKIFELVESGLDIGEDRYSFYVIAKKV